MSAPAKRRSSSSSSVSSAASAQQHQQPLPRTVSSAVRRLSNASRGGGRSAASSARASLPKQTTRVRFRSDAHLAAVARLPKREATDARASRRGGWECAPEDDIYWDGEERTFREEELTPDELVELLKQRRRQERRGVRLLSLFSRPNFRARVHAQLAAQGTYRDPLEILDSGTARLFMPRDDDEDSDERAHREQLEREHGMRRRSPPPLHAAEPGPSVLKTRRQARRESTGRRRGGQDSGAGLPSRPPRAGARGRGFSMHRDSIFALRQRRKSDLDWQDIGALAAGAALLLAVALALALRVIKPMLGLRSSVLDGVGVLALFAAVLGGAAAVVRVLPQQQANRLRGIILELGVSHGLVDPE